MGLAFPVQLKLDVTVLLFLWRGASMKKGDGVMPKFRIYGADEKTGEDTNILVNADTPDDAVAIARGRGIFTSRCVEIEFVQPPLPAKPTNEPTGKIDKRVTRKRVRGWGKGKQKYCPNCEQNVKPKLHSRQGAGCVMFIAIFALSFIIGLSLELLWLPAVGMFIALGVMLVMAHGHYACPICGTPDNELEEVR